MRAVIVQDLGFGDSGKGATVQWLCARYKAGIVCRTSGGSQCGHNVIAPGGRRHAFAQWGAGTFLGVPTYLGKHVIINPAAMENEAEHLEECGVTDPFRLLAVHPGCLVSTVFHQLLNRAREQLRGDARHGSCGHGIGEARSYFLRYDHDALFAADLLDVRTVRQKLTQIRNRLASSFGNEAARLALDVNIGLEADCLNAAGQKLTMGWGMPPCEMAVFEGAQGILLDEQYGFPPHHTWSTVTPQHAVEMAAAADPDCRPYVLGVTRSYATRHGAGPFPTGREADDDPGNPPNQWQGTIRRGPLDFALLRYAAAVARMTGGLDGIAVNHLDQWDKIGMVSLRYHNVELAAERDPDAARQERLGSHLRSVKPVYKTVDPDVLLALVGSIAPVVLRGYGPSAADREGGIPQF
jgi:adenylosuccinate synthase